MSYKYIICLPVLILLLLTTNSLYAYGGNKTTFQLEANAEGVIVGTEVPVTITGQEMKDLYAFEIEVEFDTNKLELIRAESAIAGFKVPVKQEGNRITYALSKTGNTEGESGEIDLCTLIFRGKSTGTAKIKLHTVKILNSQLQSNYYEPEKQVDVLILEDSKEEEPKDEETGGGKSGDEETEDNKQDNPAPSQENNANKNGGEETSIITGEGVVKILGKTKVNSEERSVVTSIDEKTIEDAFKHANIDSNGKKKIVLEVRKVGSAEEYRQKLPLKIVAAQTKDRSLEIQTPIATVTIPENMMDIEKYNREEEIEISIRNADRSKIDENTKQKIGNRPIIEIDTIVGGKKIEWNNSNAPVTIAIKYTPTEEEVRNPEHIVVWYINENGKIISVPNGRYDQKTGTVIFTTTHFSKYAVAFVHKTFQDIMNSWAKKEIEVLASKGIINGTTDTTYDPKRSISRADFLVLLIRTLELTGDVDTNFIDVRPEDYYYREIGIAKKLGITAGIGDNRFDPKASISREDMMVLTARALSVTNKVSGEIDDSVLKNFHDADKVSSYAKDSITLLLNNNIIQGTRENILPNNDTTREEIAVLMYNIYYQ